MSATYRAYSLERKAQLLEGDFGYWVFRAEFDCPERHQELNGLALPPDHPFWQEYYPPLDDTCGCYVIGAHSERSAKTMGGDPTKPLPKWCE